MHPGCGLSFDFGWPGPRSWVAVDQLGLVQPDRRLHQCVVQGVAVCLVVLWGLPRYCAPATVCVVRSTPTLADVAAAAKVHKATASRALNPATRDMVNSQTARRVRAAALRLGYTPNTVASGLRTKRTSSIGVVVPDLTNPLFPPIVRGIEDVLNARGYVALLANTDNDDQRELQVIESLRARRVDGFILATARRSHPLLDVMARWDTPIVLVNRTTDQDDISSVHGDDAAGVRAAVEHLVQLGHRFIVHLAGPDSLSTGRVRSQAFADAMRRHRLRVHKRDLVTCESYSVPAGYAAGRHLLSTHPDVTAIVASNDLIALGALQALRDGGLTCPHDISVVGFNDMPFVDQLSPSLTTIRLPQYAAGAQSAELLLERLVNPDAIVKSVLLPVELVVRGSTGPCRPRGHAKR